MRNAVDALEGRGEGGAIRVEICRAEAGMVEVRVEDNGPGLDAGIQEKLFQPFITTKADGMGVGLSVCRNIIDAHGGRIAGENRAEGGARFRVLLPTTAGSDG